MKIGFADDRGRELILDSDQKYEAIPFAKLGRAAAGWFRFVMDGSGGSPDSLAGLVLPLAVPALGAFYLRDLYPRAFYLIASAATSTGVGTTVYLHAKHRAQFHRAVGKILSNAENAKNSVYYTLVIGDLVQEQIRQCTFTSTCHLRSEGELRILENPPTESQVRDVLVDLDGRNQLCNSLNGPLRKREVLRQILAQLQWAH